MSELNENYDDSRKHGKFKVPHVYVIIFSLIVIAAISTYFIPAGEYDRTEIDGRAVVVDGSYKGIESEPVGFLDIFQSVHQGMVNGAEIIFLSLL